MRPTIKDVAREAKVSISTVSYAVNNSDRISEKTRLHVLEVAKKLNYVANTNAKRLRQKNNGAIGIFFNSWLNSVSGEIIQGVEKIAHDKGYDLIACSVYGGTESTAHKYLKDKVVDGAIILNSSFDDEFLISTANKNQPLVVLDREIKAPNIYNILIDNFGGSFAATKALVDSGCKNIFYFGGPDDSYNNQKRLEGYIAALGFLNIKFSPDFIIHSDFTEVGAYDQMMSLLKQGIKPKAIFSGNDDMAIGIMKAAKMNNLSIPEDLKLIGFDNSRESEVTTPTLSTVTHNKFEMGVKAASVLFDALDCENEVEPVTILPTKLIVRETM